MRAIIIAAGRGQRLGPNTDERPKCLVDIGGRPILGHQLHAFSENDVDEIHIVRGYLAERIQVPGATYHANPGWADNNILLSLFCAEAALVGPCLSTYGDILFSPAVVRAAIAGPNDISLVVDRRWREAYDGRQDHPVAQAELTVVDGDRVVTVGKQVGPEDAVGEFIGLAAYSEAGARTMREVFAEVRDAYRGRENEPFQAAAQFRKAYLTDLFQEMTDLGTAVHCVAIKQGWKEIDTVEDYEKAVKALKTLEE